MAKQYLIIDGYNLMHAAGFARRRYGPGGLEKSRLRLLGFLASHLTFAEREYCTVVFDAWEPPIDATPLGRQAGMLIQFADSGKDADTVIEELLQYHSAPRQVTVVSGDRRLLTAAKRRRAVGVTAEEFHEKLLDRGPVSKAVIAPPALSTEDAAETEYWLREFGFDPDAIALQAPEAEAPPASDRVEADVPPAERSNLPQPKRPPAPDDSVESLELGDDWLDRLQEEVDGWQSDD